MPKHDNANIQVQFFGTTGAFPAPGASHIEYSGHTSCVTLRFPNDHLFILDAGSGIIPLGHQLLKENSPVNATIFISHEHWDHIHGIMFFKPFYHTENHFKIYGPSQGTRSVNELLSIQMNGIFFPLQFNQLAAQIETYDLLPNAHFEIDDIHVSTIQLQHPSLTLGYRFQYQSKTICFLVDNELYYQDHPNYHADFLSRLTEFSNGADLIITDCTFTDEEYQYRVGWGHSCPSQLAPFAHHAFAKQLILHHHDHSESDDIINDKLTYTQKLLSKLNSKTTCDAPTAGEILLI